jgi:ribosome-associated translation inhibitor RaiA
MQIPPEITYRNVNKTEDIEDLIAKKIVTLERVCDYMVSCRVAIERRHQNQHTGNPYSVRVDIRVPPGHELVVKHISTNGEQEEQLHTALHRTFEIMRRQLKELVERQRGDVKAHHNSR